MTSAIPTASRIAVAIASGVAATFCVDSHLSGAPGPADIAVGAMLAVAAVWLCIGVNTRRMACIAAALMTAHVLLVPGSVIPGVLAVLTTVLTLPLLLLGGGGAVLLPRAWRETH
ncbi:hypothetical protein [Wenxinia saemankumensis]|uniref:Uncharacterized protein n=1 Tax=Wenxinia saemankumensis TaxID=1447782 RepID=A0A1M6A1P7_9RHOB|nr:hypothetical protein [Wenxinia saemankumensis]SHI30249.1 hypothetical protein SAMN05444417_0149 [Wenxinia saemankumensis]